jgi:metal-responsive CopG/Arc/MetJ family transcriptional regulator
MNTKPVGVSIGPSLLTRLDEWIAAENDRCSDTCDRLARSQVIREAIRQFLDRQVGE